jgi:hypothetical protein
MVRAQVEQYRYDWTLEHRRSGGDVGMERVVGAGCAIAPGLFMTPLSSILEASNAGHMVTHFTNINNADYYCRMENRCCGGGQGV